MLGSVSMSIERPLVEAWNNAAIQRHIVDERKSDQVYSKL